MDYRIPGSILELFPQFIDSWYGDVFGHANIKLFSLKSLNYSLVTQESEIKVKSAPMVFEDVRANIFGDYSFITIDDLYARVGGGGEINVEGFIQLKKGFPTVDIDYRLSTARLNLTENSYLNLGGFGRIFGQSKPYFFNGAFNILNSEINDDPKILFNLKDSALGSNETKLDWFDFNVGLNTVSRIKLSNSLANFDLDLNLQFLGIAPEFSTVGSVKMDSGSGKLFFKGHEFKIRNGDIFLESRKRQ